MTPHTSFSVHHSALVFDRAGLIARLMDDETLACEIIQGFLMDIPAQIEALKGYLVTGDAVGAGRQAHTIKGASANVGGERLCAVAFEMEQATKAGELDAVTARLPELESRFFQLKAAMELAVTTQVVRSQNSESRMSVKAENF